MKNEIDLLELSMYDLIQYYENRDDGLIIYPNKNYTDGFFFYSESLLKGTFSRDDYNKDDKFYVYVKKYKNKRTPKYIQVYDKRGRFIGDVDFDKRFYIYKIYDKLLLELRMKKFKRVLKGF